MGLAFLKRLDRGRQRIPLTKSKTGEIVKAGKSLEGSLFPMDLNNVNINYDTTSLLLKITNIKRLAASLIKFGF